LASKKILYSRILQKSVAIMLETRILSMAIPVVEFSREGYKIRKLVG
jgi:hypothetical protein